MREDTGTSANSTDEPLLVASVVMRPYVFSGGPSTNGGARRLRRISIGDPRDSAKIPTPGNTGTAKRPKRPRYSRARWGTLNRYMRPAIAGGSLYTIAVAWFVAVTGFSAEKTEDPAGNGSTH